jgi:hypothetical protein
MSVNAELIEDLPVEKPDTTVYLILGERSFPCRRTSVTWHMMQFGHAQRTAQRIRAPHPDVVDPEDTNKRIPHDCPQCKKAQSDRTNAGMEMMNAMRAHSQGS